MLDGYEVCSYAKILYVVSAHSFDKPSKQVLFGSPCIGRREGKIAWGLVMQGYL